MPSPFAVVAALAALCLACGCGAVWAPGLAPVAGLLAGAEVVAAGWAILSDTGEGEPCT